MGIRERVDFGQKSLRAIFIVVLIVAVSAWLFVTKFILPPADYTGAGADPVKVKILKGQSISKIGNVLKTAGVVSSVDRFVSACTQDPSCLSLQPGTYQLRTRLPVQQAISDLLDPQNRIFTGLLIKEGLRSSEIISLLSEYTNIPESEFVAALKHPKALNLPDWANGNAEGFLFPAIYDFPKTDSATQILKLLVTKAKSEYNSVGLIKHAETLGISPQELITMASLVQAESHPRDYPKVSRVILNRLATPMRLQFDSTVAYGLNKKQVILTTSDLQTDTPYNTYMRDGLPPGPIGNPGVEAIVAAANPAQGNWLYFVTVNLKTGETKFTESYDQFLTYKDEFLNFCRTNQGSC